MFSVVTIALSYKAISKNKTISEKDTQPADEKSKVEVKDSEERKIVEGSFVFRLARAAVVGATATGGIAGVAVLGGIAGGMVGCTLGSVILGLYVDNSKEGDARRGAIIDNAAYGLNIARDALYSGKCAYDNDVQSIESVKGTFSGIGGGLKNVYDTSVEYTKGALNSVGSSLYSRIYGTKVSSPEEPFNKDLNHSNVEASNPENQPAKEENGQGWAAWGLGKAKSAMTEVVVGADVTKPYFAKITKALAPNLNM